MRLVLFDADGTLVDSQAIIHETMCLCFNRFGYSPPGIAETRSIIGLTLENAIASILRREIDSEIAQMAQEYRETYVELAPREDLQTRAFDGIPELIHRLSQDDELLLGIVTGKSRRGVEKLLATNDFGKSFVVSRCADDCPSKPHPAMVLECCSQTGVPPVHALVVGDTSFDMEMASSAGSSAIGVSWGYHPAEKLIAPNVRAVVDTPCDLEDGIAAWKQGFPVAGGSSPLTAQAERARVHFLYA